MSHHVPVVPRADGRAIPAHRLDEKDMLTAWLRFARATVVAKATGLSGTQLRHRFVGSAMTLGGILKHLVTVERHWFSNVLGGRGVPMPFHAGDPDGDWHVSATDDIEGIVHAYAEACAASDTVIDALDLDDTGAQTDDDYTLRWALVHATMDTYRHAGHADLLRELLDGERGW